MPDTRSIFSVCACNTIMATRLRAGFLYVYGPTPVVKYLLTNQIKITKILFALVELKTI
jgi:hypothetical protein